MNLNKNSLIGYLYLAQSTTLWFERLAELFLYLPLPTLPMEIDAPTSQHYFFRF